MVKQTKEEKSSFEDRFKEIGAIWENNKGHLSIQVREEIPKDKRLVAFVNQYADENEKAPKWRLFLPLDED